SGVNQGPSSTRLAVLPSEWLVSAKIGFLRIIRPFSSGGVIGITQTHGTRRLRRAIQPLLTVKKNAACNKGRGAKDEARLIETSAKRSYVPVVYYGSRRLLPNARCKSYTHARIDTFIYVSSRIGFPRRGEGESSRGEAPKLELIGGGRIAGQPRRDDDRMAGWLWMGERRRVTSAEGIELSTEAEGATSKDKLPA
ncbi:hypothetical protein ALC62_14120, partial [Cyphomyrmex costatus]